MSTLQLGLIDAGIMIGSLLLFGVTFLVARAATRPAAVTAAPATPDLGDEPPAVVSLLANRWRLTDDASESTLLDLAARGYLELRQPGDDPRHTTIQLRAPEHPAPLLAYERRVLHRIEDLAVDGVVPVTALTFRDRQRARGWNRRLRQEVVADARRRGLSRRRLDAIWASVLLVTAGLSAVGVAVAAIRLALRGDGNLLAGPVFGIAAFASCAAVTGFFGERDTATGRKVAARWLGVRAWLAGHEAFADLPPAAVAVWDRYLSYGAALGVTHTTSEVLDLGLGDRRLVWSSYGGRWRRVRVRYPKLLPRYGSTATGLLVRAVLATVTGGLLVWRFGMPALTVPELPAEPDLPAVQEFAGHVLGLLALVLLTYGGYVWSRTLLDLATTRTITGEVLWRERWRSRRQGRHGPSVPWLDYLAVDDGRSDRTRAWGLPRQLAPDVHDRDEVTIRARPWTRRIVALTVVTPGRARQLRDAPVPKPGSGPEPSQPAGGQRGWLPPADGSASGSSGPVPSPGSMPPKPVPPGPPAGSSS